MAAKSYEPEIVKTTRISEALENYCSLEGKDDGLRREIKRLESEKNVPFRIVKEVYSALSKLGETELFLHELIEGSDLFLPEYIPEPRNPELEARCKKLRAQWENQQYREMVKNVDRSQPDYYSAGKDVKEMNRQLVSVFNFIITVGGAFAFGYKATEYMFTGHHNTFALQLVAGLALAMVVFFADLYFLVRESS